MSWDIQQLYELAEAELESGQPDRATAARALTEANGIRAKARQIYWLLRATQLEAEAAKAPNPDRFLYALKTKVEIQRRAFERKKNLHGWLGVGLCYSALAAAFIFGCAALPAFRHESEWAPIFAIAATLAAALGIVGVAVAKHEKPVDPFLSS